MGDQLYRYVYVYIDIDIDIYVDVYVYVYVYVYIYIYVYVYIYIYIYIDIDIYVYITYMYMYTYYIYILYIYTYYIYIHYIYIFYTHQLSKSWSPLFLIGLRKIHYVDSESAQLSEGLPYKDPKSALSMQRSRLRKTLSQRLMSWLALRLMCLENQVNPK